MSDHDFNPAGTSIRPELLRIPRARSVARFAEATTNPNVRLLHCYGSRENGSEAVELAISATVPQRPVYDIRPTERILIAFKQDDGWYPIVESLRKDFPHAPHTNLTFPGEPRSLCLYSEPWEDVRITLTAPKLIARIMWWLEGTATDTLHGEGQPLEPLLFDPRWDLIIPHDLPSTDDAGEAETFTCYTTGWGLRLVRSPMPTEGDGVQAQVGSCLALVIRCQPQPHSVVRSTPSPLADLCNFLLPAGVDLLELLRERLDAWTDKKAGLLSVEGFGLVLLARLPKTRVAGGEAESEELRAFAFKGPIGAIAKAAVAPSDDHARDGPEDIGQQIELLPLNHRPGFSRMLAAKANGESREDSSRVIAVGAGALGSQVVMNLARGGFGQWTLVDDDLLQPHNLARHGLGGWAVGRPKAMGLADMLNGMVEGPPIAEGVATNVLRNPASDNQVAVDWKSASAILDMSASIGVARYLRHEIRSPARRISLFLNPSGAALTLLAEDKPRGIPLDVLEMQYYRALIRDAGLAGLLSSSSTMRSGVGCRDVSARIPQDLVGLFAGIGSRAVRRAIETDQVHIVTWVVDEASYSVSNTTIDVPRVRRKEKDGWRIFWDDHLESKLRKYRDAKLPNETGGILIGSFDIARRIIYVFDATKAPPDSEESLHGFLRGSKGLQNEVEGIQVATSGMLGYIGEWHSHPNGNTKPSTRDKDVIKWVKETLDDEGQVGVVGIVGSKKQFNLIPCGTALYQ